MPKREQVAPFVRKTFDMVSERNYAEIVSWAEDGQSFVIRKPQKFRKKVIPLYFKHNNLCSFIRQLNTYGFHKVNKLKKDDFNSFNAIENLLNASDDVLEFQHQYFVKNRKDLLAEIVRKKKLAKPKATEEDNSETKNKSSKNDNNNLSLIDSPSNSSTASSPLTSPESSPSSSPLHPSSSSSSPYAHFQHRHEEYEDARHHFLIQQIQFSNEEKQRMKEESKKLNNTISYLSYQVQILTSELKNSQDKIRELERELFISTQNQLSPFDLPSINNQNLGNQIHNSRSHNNNNNNNNSFVAKKRKLNDHNNNINTNNQMNNACSFSSDLSQYYIDFPNSFFIQEPFAG